MKNRCFLLAALFLWSAIPKLQADEATERLVLSTFKIFHKDSTATGLVVEKDGARFVITAHHVLDKIPDSACLLVGRSKPENSKEYRRKDLRLVIRDDSGKPLWKKHPKHDLAVLKLPEDFGNEEFLVSLPFSTLAKVGEAEKLHTGDPLFAAVFPERDEANGAGFPIVRGGTIASYPITPIDVHWQFLIDMTAFNGDSGGPVIHQKLRRENGDPVVVGFVLGLRHTTETVKESKFVEKKIRHPLGIAYAIHAAFAFEVIAEFDEKKTDQK